jgi:hypothetical protein
LINRKDELIDMKKQLSINISACWDFLKKGITMEQINNYKKIIDEKFPWDVFSCYQCALFIQNNVEVNDIEEYKKKNIGKHNDVIVKLLTSNIKPAQFDKIERALWEDIIKINTLLIIRRTWISPDKIDEFIKSLKIYTKGAIKENFDGTVKELILQKNFLEVFNFLEKNQDFTIRIWKTNIKLYWNPQMLNWLLTLINRNLDWKPLNMKNNIKDYEKTLNEYQQFPHFDINMNNSYNIIKKCID